jgi:hypothetical protein
MACSPYPLRRTPRGVLRDARSSARHTLFSNCSKTQSGIWKFRASKSTIIAGCRFAHPLRDFRVSTLRDQAGASPRMPELIINGPAGRLESRYHHESGSTSPVALILHPHPQFGGTMNNQVVYALYYMFVERGGSISAGLAAARATSTTARASWRTPPPRSTGCSYKTRIRARAGSPVCRSAPGSPCNC